jgi:tripartite-type tricarboxylate transporter receptor subunit TctC
MVRDHQVGRPQGGMIIAKPSMKLTLPLVSLLATVLAAPAPAAAQDYPSRPITLIVPYAAGGGNDVMARTAAERMSKTLGQQIVVENRAGAGGSIATRQVAKADPDGYTLGLGGTGTLAIDPTLYGNVGYDPRKDFAPVGLIATSALVVCVHPSLPVRSIPDLIALAKREPGKLNYASAGTGSGIHLATEYFAAMAGIKLSHIPYKGSSPALTDLVGGHVAIYFSSLPPAVGLLKEGKVRALAVTSAKRSAVFPDLPTVAEAALPGYEAVLHYGVVAPAGTPQAIIDKLGGALRAAVMSDELKSRLAQDGAEPLPSTPEEYAADIDREERKWSALIKSAGLKAQ